MQTINRPLIAFVYIALGCTTMQAQLVIKLAPNTVSAFDAYARKVEDSLQDRWTAMGKSGKASFLQMEDDPPDLARCLRGDLIVKPEGSGNPVEVPGGLIHDWRGAVFIPETTIERVLGVLEDFDKHQSIYPEVSASHTMERNGHDIKGYWRLRQKGMVPVILDVEQHVVYQQLSPGKWKGQAYARKIIETDTTPFSRGRQFPPDEGHGYLWRLYSYWTLVERAGGVLAECRTLSLSRDIPAGLAWAVGPYVQKMPESSLASTLEHTRSAALQTSKP